jgi:hypothetical protein
MSKAIRKHRPISRPSEGRGPEQSRWDGRVTARNRNIILIVFIAIFAAIPFMLGKYFEFSQPDAFDGGAYAYSAQHILSGARIGVEEKPSALLGTLLVNMLGEWLFGFNETGAEIIQTILQITALILMFITMRKLFGILAAAVGVIIASLYLSSPIIAKFGNVKEQYMIACMVIGISCYILYQLPLAGRSTPAIAGSATAGSGQVCGRWWYAMLAGAFLGWAPLFKQTGMSAIGAIGIFTVLQPFLRHRTWKQTGIDILLLSAGAIAAIGPLYIWILGWNVQISLPYLFVWQTLTTLLPTGAEAEQVKPGLDYVTTARTFVPFSKQWPVVLRFYSLLILPIALAAGSIIVKVVRMIYSKLKKSKGDSKPVYERFVLLLAMLWVLDMAFVWISPSSYEQYYLPLNASAAMLGGYLIAVYRDKFTAAANKTGWLITGIAGLLIMILMSLHIFFGIEKSPYSGQSYGRKQKGYSQRLAEISQRRKHNLKDPWEQVGEYIRTNSQPTDKIYVWGWFPGIYVAAQRFSSASRACIIPHVTPQQLEETIAELLSEFDKEMPKFIVDSRKRHIPTERPPYELWPIVLKGFIGAKETRPLSIDKEEIARYDTEWSKILREHFGEDEALRYEILKPFREFVMKNYRIVQLFGQHVLFELK